MTTKIYKLQAIVGSKEVMNSSWMEKQNISRSEQVMYLRSGWLKRIANGMYQFANSKPTLFGALTSLEKQMGLSYHIAASTALELLGVTHYITMGKPLAYIATPVKHHLSKWMLQRDWDRVLKEFSTNVFPSGIGIISMEEEGFSIKVSTPELAIMECLLLSPNYFNLVDVYYLFEMLSMLRPEHVTLLLEQTSSVKVKRLFLYMAEKTNYSWFKELDLSNVSLGSGPRSFCKGGVKIAKYNIIVPRELKNMV